MASPDLTQLQLHQQNLQNVLMQKQQFSQQLVELESALKELPTSTSTYKIVGKLMIAKSKEDLVKELEGKKETIGLRIKSIEAQEKKIKDSLEQAQKKVLEEMQKGK